MATGFSWAPYTPPTMTPGPSGAAGNFNFYRPSDSQMPTGTDLQNYLQPNGPTTDPSTTTNRTVKYDGGLTREMMGNTTNFLNTNMGNGFSQLSDQLNYGGTYGDGGRGRTYSPTSQNGYGTGWAGSNPFMIGTF